MNKAQLLDYIRDLPDDLVLGGYQLEMPEKPEPTSWQQMSEIGLYERREPTRLLMTLELVTWSHVTARFRRTYEEPDGLWYDRRSTRIDGFRTPK